ncbi:unnamed protein product [Ambrosiozyma monospora]|uniref:Unnamed protein product n=1 Tax=Ambrosiozyma monospora TaxID=43982 RepID=A0ACB5TAR4_AMBMO|nr:unnamed protein product [Ambrosiozyma monospora]
MGKRSFYTDDDEISSTPGLTSAISPELETKQVVQIDDNTKFVKGKLIKTFPQLEQFSNQWRKWLISKTDVATAEYDNLKSAVNNEISTVTNKTSELITEPVLPSTIYILTAALTGSILSNRRNIAVRFLAPTVFGIASFKYFMPHSFSNVGNWLYQLEGEYVPEVQKFQDDTTKSTNDLIAAAEQFQKETNDSLVSSVKETRQYIMDWVSKK